MELFNLYTVQKSNEIIENQISKKSKINTKSSKYKSLAVTCSLVLVAVTLIATAYATGPVHTIAQTSISSVY